MMIEKRLHAVDREVAGCLGRFTSQRVGASGGQKETGSSHFSPRIWVSAHCRRLAVQSSLHMKTIALYDVDSRIPNLALMKLSAWHKRHEHRVSKLIRGVHSVAADTHFAAVVFQRGPSERKVAALRDLYGDDIRFGGSGYNVRVKLPREVEAQFPDYGLYEHTDYAIGFLTRGCNGACIFTRRRMKTGFGSNRVDALTPPLM